MSAENPLLMIVDDSRMSRMLIKAIVNAQRPAWRVVEAASGDEALRQIDAETPVYVTMDVNMPGMNGLEAAARIRIRHPEVRIAVCTANVQESTREAAAKAGLCFISKPITEEGVRQAITFFEGAA